MLYQTTFTSIKIKQTSQSNPFNTKVWQGFVLDMVSVLMPELKEVFHKDSNNYPTIQFRNTNNMASIVAVGATAKLYVSLFSQKFKDAYQSSSIKDIIKNTNNNYTKYLDFSEELYQIIETTVQYPKTVTLAKQNTYTIPYYILSKKLKKWKTYTTVKSIENDKTELTLFLNRNIKEFFTKALQLEFPEIDLQITNIENFEHYDIFKKANPKKPNTTINHKGVLLTFTTNLLIPELTAIASGKALGFGCVYKK